MRAEPDWSLECQRPPVQTSLSVLFPNNLRGEDLVALLEKPDFPEELGELRGKGDWAFVLSSHQAFWPRTNFNGLKLTSLGSLLLNCLEKS